MDDTTDFNALTSARGEEELEKISQDCKKMAAFFEANATDVFEGQEGPIFHLEFDSPEKFEKFAEYLKSCNLLPADAIRSKSEERY